MGRVPFFLIFFLFLSLPNSSLSSFSFNSSSPLCHSDQSSALLHFRNSFSVGLSNPKCVVGEYSSNYYPPKNLWKMGTDCCGWDGVTCDAMTGHVIAVDLSCSGLHGPIHPNTTLFSLCHLQRLNLAYNNFNYSAILSKFGGFANMTHLNLTDSSVAGNFPSEISHLSKLVSLDLSWNVDMRIETPSLKKLVQNLTHLTELVLDYVDMFSVSPNSFMNLSSSLTSLRLIECGLNGRFPDNIFHLPNLQLLYLSNNYNLTGSLPTYNWSTPLQSLKELYLRECNFIGQIPRSLIIFEGPTDLDLSGNNFQGQLPEVTTNLTQIFSSNNYSNSQLVNKIPSNLEYLDLSGNLLNGTIPSWVYTISSLRYLYLDHNQFTGHIGDFQHNSLVALMLNNNNLDGPLPLSISKLVSLLALGVSFNNLSGNVESKIFSKLKSLEYLDMSNNPLLSLSSFTFATNILPKINSLLLSSSYIIEIPHFLRTAECIGYLDLSKNQIKGNIPKWFLEVGKDSLFSLNLSYNSLTSIRHLPWKNLQMLDLSSNLLQGPLPVPPLSTYFFSVSRNTLIGNIPSLICNITSLNILDLSHNHLSNMVPPCLGNFSQFLTVLDLRSNELNGTIPATFAKGNYLRSLNLNDNQLEGSLPRSLINCRRLEVLDLGNNKVSDTFPHWLGSLPELRVLVLQSNKFYGVIANPSTKFSFLNLRIIDLSHNDFHGLLPTEYFNHFKAMMSMNANNGELSYMGGSYYHYSVLVTIKGFDIEMGKIQNLFTIIDCSNNRFRGEIPQSIGKLKLLTMLDFSHNSLVGPMPPSLGNLSNLEWLDLSSNMLIGNIPRQLVDLTFLAFLNLSKNCLVGPIPEGNQLLTFTNASYFGNFGLCGFPLARACNKNL